MLDFLSINYLSSKMADKLTKDIAKSASRKAFRTQSNQVACLAIMKTAAYGNINLSLALLVADLASLVAEYLAYHYNCLRLLPHKDYRPVDLWHRTGKILVNNMACYCCFVIGSCLGTLAYPGIGTSIGGIVGDLVIYVL